MKKLTLDQTWRECLRMWKWIAEQVKAGNALAVSTLKWIWLKKHGYKATGYDSQNCFFCQFSYSFNPRNPGSCSLCPGRKVNRYFKCQAKRYFWKENPIAFYAELVRLNKIRLAKKGKDVAK